MSVGNNKIILFECNTENKRITILKTSSYCSALQYWYLAETLRANREFWMPQKLSVLKKYIVKTLAPPGAGLVRD